MDVTGIGDVASLLKDGLDRLFPNKNDPAYITAQAALIAAQQQGAFKDMDNNFQLALEQIKTNAVAESKGDFTFRDGAGWTCVFMLGIMGLKPLIEWGSILVSHPVQLPAIDTTWAISTLGSLLGIGGMHTYQAVKS